MDVKKIYLREVKFSKYELDELKHCKDLLVDVWIEGVVPETGMTLEEARKKFSPHTMFKPILDLIDELLED